MTKHETDRAERMLGDDDWCERTERSGYDLGAGRGWCITAYWRDGGQKLFYLLDDVAREVQS
jgi:hypothetical protein